jgi:hypothetical protein
MSAVVKCVFDDTGIRAFNNNLATPTCWKQIMNFSMQNGTIPSFTVQETTKKNPSLLLFYFFVWGVVMLSIFRLKELEGCQVLH